MVNLEDLGAQIRSRSYEELATLSLDAAIELDRLQRGEPIDSDTIGTLVDSLGLRSSDIGSGDALRRLADPTTVDLYNRAVFHLTNVPANTVDDLAKQVRSYADVFGRGVKTASKEELRALRDFCLALHRELVAEIYDRNIDMSTDPA